jgi:hypothetical protein
VKGFAVHMQALRVSKTPASSHRIAVTLSHRCRWIVIQLSPQTSTYRPVMQAGRQAPCVPTAPVPARTC